MPGPLEVAVVVRQNRLPAISRRSGSILDSQINRAARDLRDYADESFRGPKSGRIYKYYTASGGIILHQASAAGESPAILTENLAKSARIESIQLGKAVTWNKPYAPNLEMGAGSLAPRPFARPAAIFVFPKLVNRIKRDLERV